ncbi:MAG: hypothetical protein U9N49_10160 [Campylobacterota bacterium]|nr:hypothetical protein [Campylobacterota bacterium]
MNTFEMPVNMLGQPRGINPEYQEGTYVNKRNEVVPRNSKITFQLSHLEPDEHGFGKEIILDVTVAFDQKEVTDRQQMIDLGIAMQKFNNYPIQLKTTGFPRQEGYTSLYRVSLDYTYVEFKSLFIDSKKSLVDKQTK